MKYFTPELLARYRSLDDDVADLAAQEWEKAISSYRARLKAIRLRLPSRVRWLRSHFSLHDAKILAIGFGEKTPRLALVIQLEGVLSQPGLVLELDYHLVAGPHGGVTVEKKADFDSDSPGWIIHDEFDLDEERAFFIHSLLLSKDKEIDIRFHSLRVRTLNTFHLAPFKFTDAARTWPLVEA